MSKKKRNICNICGYVGIGAILLYTKLRLLESTMSSLIVALVIAVVGTLSLIIKVIIELSCNEEYIGSVGLIIISLFNIVFVLPKLL